jgi:hypothetical protein
MFIHQGMCVNSNTIFVSVLTIHYFYNINKPIKQYGYQERNELVDMDIILKSILRRQIPFLISGIIMGTVMTMDFLLLL